MQNRTLIQKDVSQLLAACFLLEGGLQLTEAQRSGAELPNQEYKNLRLDATCHEV